MKRFLALSLFCICAAAAHAQAPRISALYPAGARAGETIEVAVKGGSLVGARQVVVTGAPGVTAELVGGAANVDEGARPLFQAKCTTCHEPRSPANRSMSPDQWASTVDRMIKSRGAEINDADKARIVGYLQALAKAGQVGIKVQVAKDAAPGAREVRVLTGQGVSSAYTFEVGSTPEVSLQAGNATPETAQKVTLPVVVNGVVTKSGEKQFFAFEAKKGETLTLSLKAYRLSEISASFFNPVLYVYDAAGKEVAKNLGRFGTDPALDFTAPEDGTYTLLVRDLVWKGSPSSVYRLTLAKQTAEGILSPVAAVPGARLSARLVASEESAPSPTFALSVPEGQQGVTMVATPMGEAPLLIRDLPDGGGPNPASAVALPGVFRGCISQPNQTDKFKVRAQRGGGALEIYARRLGSPLRPRVTVTDAKGNVTARRIGTGEDDLRVSNAFPSPGEYTVEIADADNGSGAAYAYCWEALDGTPDFQLIAQPDVINLAPGASSALLVRAVRKENLRGPVSITVSGLPPGVTASPATLLPDMETVAVPVTAAPGTSVSAAPIVVTGATTAGDNGPTVTRRARALEVYRVNNNLRRTPVIRRWLR